MGASFPRLYAVLGAWAHLFYIKDIREKKFFKIKRIFIFRCAGCALMPLINSISTHLGRMYGRIFL
jgi:hypothetical protein